MSLSKIVALLLAVGLLASSPARADSLQEPELIRQPVPGRFNICFNHGCRDLADVSLKTGEWRRIETIFSAEVHSAREERERIAQAIGRLESMVGELTGTHGDEGGSLAGLWKRNQMDCVDESTNTHTYLVMLKNSGLLKYHAPLENKRRILPRLYQHYTAVMRETATGQEYAVDSWFLDNGRPPFIIPMETWRRGWTPGDEIPEDVTPVSSKTSD